MTDNNNNLSNLNDILFDTLRGVKNDEIKPDKAKAIVNVSNSIVSNAKAQLEAFKMTKGRVDPPKLFGTKIESSLLIAQGDTYDQMEEYAKKKGYRNITEAIAKMGKDGFNIAFENYRKENQ